jgi:hypothetical protein
MPYKVGLPNRNPSKRCSGIPDMLSFIITAQELIININPSFKGKKITEFTLLQSYNQ